MKVVLDANVVLSALLAEGLCRVVLLEATHKHQIISSHVILNEVEEKLLTKVKPGVHGRRFLLAYRTWAEMVNPVPLPEPVCRDPDDDWVLATAVAGKAEAIITGDDDLLTLKSYKKIRLLTPRQFLELLHLQS